MNSSYAINVFKLLQLQINANITAGVWNWFAYARGQMVDGLNSANAYLEDSAVSLLLHISRTVR